MSNLLRSTDSNVTINPDGSLTINTQPIGSLPAATSIADTDVLHVEQGSTDRNITRAVLLNGLDVAGTTALSSLPSSGNLLFLTSAGALALLPVGLLPTGSGSGGTAATAPGQVGSLAAGTPTSTTIPIGYTAAAGTAPIAYAAWTAPHGSTTWTANAASFGATGGTLTGLTAATNYDIRIVATNSAGSSTTTLTAGITTATASAEAGAAALTMTGATYGFKSGTSGAKMLTAGSAAGTVTLPSSGQFFAKVGGVMT